MYLRQLAEEERQALLSELNDDLFSTHINHPVYLKTGSLRDGTSIWYHDKDGDFLNGNTCPRTIAFIQDFANGRQVGRSYAHRMMPGTIIYPHNDQAYRYFFQIDRYQVFLDMPTGFVVQHHYQPRENSIGWFDHRSSHAYQNNSDRPVYFLVIDLFKPEG